VIGILLNIIQPINVFRARVSKTRPAWCVCVDCVIIKNYKIWLKLQFYALSRHPLLAHPLYWGPRRPIFIFMRPTSSFFVKIWPSNEFEFETPGLERGNQNAKIFGRLLTTCSPSISMLGGNVFLLLLKQSGQR